MVYRSVFISDVHLGTRWSKAEELASFLSSIRCEKLYLVGDIIDGWKLRNNPRWPQSHNRVIRKILKMAKRSEVFYITGNHDEFVDEFEGYDFGGIRICKKTSHITADNRRFMVIHGDEFDVVVKYRKWLAFLGDTAYTFALYLNDILTWIRSRLGLPYWSLSQYLKHRVKDAVAFVGDFEETLLAETRKGNHHGVICGHIHRPTIRNIEDTVYCNSGDWVESCSALVEHADGTLEVVRWDGEKIIGDVCERPKLLEMDYVVSPDTNNCPEKRVPLAV
ncbi:MAG TPA: UDP-2,3-diacylglucosamine diphosphatase [Synergistales bacterium]|jgi:UDP-2,3-diacylglucosamine pyrophosphatase LpxH|nr:UDP-2,3-diacylglucosamine diphosphatase [Synergistales bacterium]HRV72200.1 UDP-2,3-diacylglucosamine diphosphatase [Thermovirgaceae bacterium]